jgi:hypothetical protein
VEHVIEMSGLTKVFGRRRAEVGPYVPFANAFVFVAAVTVVNKRDA